MGRKPLALRSAKYCVRAHTKTTHRPIIAQKYEETAHLALRRAAGVQKIYNRTQTQVQVQVRTRPTMIGDTPAIIVIFRTHGIKSKT